jgi:hypothetical protein
VQIAEHGYAATPEYQARIEATFPMRDGRCCERVTAAIEALDGVTAEPKGAVVADAAELSPAG